MKVFVMTILFIVFYFDSYSQKVSINSGLYLNTMFGSSKYPMGIGGVGDIEYTFDKVNFMSISLRGKFAYYSYNDNSNISYDDNGNINSYNPNPNLKYKIIIPQISIVPRFYYSIDDDIQLYIENDLSYGFISGNIDYIFSGKYSVKVDDISKNRFIYTSSIGTRIRVSNVRLLLYLGWSFFDFNNLINSYKPNSYKSDVTAQNTGIVTGISVSIPIR